MVKNEKGIGAYSSPKGEPMNKEYNNIWKLIKSEDIGISRMAISMDKGLKELNENVVSHLELYSLIMKKVDFYNENIPDTLSPKLQLKIWFWFYISALIQNREANAEYNLGIYNSYLKEL